MNTLSKVHFIDNCLIHPSNPILVNLIGAGGTGSQVLSALARINHSLVALKHPGIFVRVFDDDSVSEANLGRQLFSAAELGVCKGVALINRINRFFGTNWKAVPVKYDKKLYPHENSSTTITISCVDTVNARFEIAEMLHNQSRQNKASHNKPVYWMDFGNGQYTGQVVLSTVQPVKQPVSKKFNPNGYLPFITDEFETLLRHTDENNIPSCSLAEALTRQDLFINSTLANLGSSLLWSMFREGMIFNRGFFLNLKDFRTQPLKIS
jgi:PRTRC genetic system ThiF family protein